MITTENVLEEEWLKAFRWFVAQEYSSLTAERHGGKIRIIKRESVTELNDLKNA